MILAKQLGMIPAFQHSRDPAVNYKINPHVVYPEGMTQLTTQPIGRDYAPPEAAVAGFGAAGCDCNVFPECCGSSFDPRTWAAKTAWRRSQARTMAGLGITNPLDLFDSPVWEHRKWIVVGGAAVLGLAVLGGLTALLR